MMEVQWEIADVMKRAIFFTLKTEHFLIFALVIHQSRASFKRSYYCIEKPQWRRQ